MFDGEPAESEAHRRVSVNMEYKSDAIARTGEQKEYAQQAQHTS